MLTFAHAWLFFLAPLPLLIWWLAPAEGIATKPDGDRILAPLILVGIILALGIFAEPLVGVSIEIAHGITNPQIYIQAVLGD